MRLAAGDRFPDFSVETNRRKLDIPRELGRKTVLWVIRYIGCPVCRYDVHLLAEKYDEITAKGYDLFVVMQSDTEHIKRDLEGADIPFEIICDPELKIYDALEIIPAKNELALVGNILKLKAKGDRAKALGFVHGDYEGNELQLPALFILGEDGTVTYSHYGKNITDMPSVDELIGMLD